MTAVILAIISAPISGVLLAAAAQGKGARDQTAADQLISSKLETIRTLAYNQVGVTNGNPSGVLSPSASATLPNGVQVTIATKVVFVADPIPSVLYVTNADYKKLVITVTRVSDSKQLSTLTTYISSASAPPLAGTNWVQIKRTVQDAVTMTPFAGASVTVTGGPAPAANRTDTTDAAGTVIFPALNDSTSGTPVYAIAPALSGPLAGYLVFPDDLAPAIPEQVASSSALNSIATIRAYKSGISLVINVQKSDGTPYTGGATVSLQSSRCGVGSITIASGASSTTVTNCSWATGKTVNLVPNVLGLAPLFDKYGATAYNVAGGFWGSATPFTVPSGYPTTLTQTVNVKFSSTLYPTTKTLTVNVTKAGSPDANARVLITGGPAGVALALYGTTDASGNVSFTIPVLAASSTYTISSNDMGAASGTTTVTATTTTTSPINKSLAIS